MSIKNDLEHIKDLFFIRLEQADKMRMNKDPLQFYWQGKHSAYNHILIELENILGKYSSETNDKNNQFEPNIQWNLR